MLTIRTEQLRALNAQVRQDLRERLVWHYSVRAGEFGLDPRFVAPHIDEGLAECDKFRLYYKPEVDLFFLTVFRHYGGFLPAPISYPARALRFLSDQRADAYERVRGFAEWSEYQKNQAARRNR
jgi:hypothetical protein